MNRSVNKIPEIIAVISQNIASAKIRLDFAVTRQDWIDANNCQIRIDYATALLDVVKALGVKAEKGNG